MISVKITFSDKLKGPSKGGRIEVAAYKNIADGEDQVKIRKGQRIGHEEKKEEKDEEH